MSVLRPGVCTAVSIPSQRIVPSKGLKLWQNNSVNFSTVGESPAHIVQNVASVKI